jgi:hypothetical protein
MQHAAMEGCTTLRLPSLLVHHISECGDLACAGDTSVPSYGPYRAEPMEPPGQRCRAALMPGRHVVRCQGTSVVAENRCFRSGQSRLK